MTKEAHKLWIEGRFCESKAGGDARRCANKPKPTKGYGEVPLGTRLGDPLHKVPSEGLTGVVAEITDSRTSIRSAREKRCCSWIYAAAPMRRFRPGPVRGGGSSARQRIRRRFAHKLLCPLSRSSPWRATSSGCYDPATSGARRGGRHSANDTSPTTRGSTQTLGATQGWRCGGDVEGTLVEVEHQCPGCCLQLAA